MEEVVPDVLFLEEVERISGAPSVLVFEEFKKKSRGHPVSHFWKKMNLGSPNVLFLEKIERMARAPGVFF